MVENSRFRRLPNKSTPGNFLEETGAQGVFSESLMLPGADDFPRVYRTGNHQRIFSRGRAHRKTDEAVQKYLKSLEEIFPDAAAPRFLPKPSPIPTGESSGKSISKPIRVLQEYCRQADVGTIRAGQPRHCRGN